MLCTWDGMRIAAATILLALAPAAALAAPAGPVPTVPCDEIILHVNSGRAGGYRVVLGVVSVPPARLIQVVPSQSRPWSYWRKAGLVVRAGAPPVTVSVPPAWRSRAAITWGNSTGIVSAVRIASCRGAAGTWNAYAGGFYLRSPSACMPLRFSVAGRTRVVRFGLGRACS
jgi:hypothetical protein